MAWLIAMPALACAVGLPLYESSDAGEPPVMPTTFIQALDARNVEQAYVFILYPAGTGPQHVDPVP
jgi:hypothetical protein